MQLRDGGVLKIGGIGRGLGLGTEPVADVERFDAGAGGWHAVAPLPAPLAPPAAVQLLDGRVLVVGNSGILPTTATWLYDPGANTWRAAGALPQERYAATLTPLRGGSALLAGGADPVSAAVLDSALRPDLGDGPSAGTVRIDAPLLPPAQQQLPIAGLGVPTPPAVVVPPVPPAARRAGGTATARRHRPLARLGH